MYDSLAWEGGGLVFHDVYGWCSYSFHIWAPIWPLIDTHIIKFFVYVVYLSVVQGGGINHIGFLHIDYMDIAWWEKLYIIYILS